MGLEREHVVYSRKGYDSDQELHVGPDQMIHSPASSESWLVDKGDTSKSREDGSRIKRGECLLLMGGVFIVLGNRNRDASIS